MGSNIFKYGPLDHADDQTIWFETFEEQVMERLRSDYDVDTKLNQERSQFTADPRINECRMCTLWKFTKISKK